MLVYTRNSVYVVRSKETGEFEMERLTGNDISKIGIGEKTVAKEIRVKVGERMTFGDFQTTTVLRVDA